MIDFSTMPPAIGGDPGAESEEQKRYRLAHTMPPAASAQPKPAPDRTVMPPIPSSPAPMRPNASATPLEGRARELALGATAQPTMPPVRTMEQPAAPEIDRNVMPPIPGAGLKVAPGQPAKPASFGDAAPAPIDRSTMPPIPQSGAEKREQELRAQGRPGSPEGPDLPWWKRALDTVAQIHPIGKLIERNIPGSPGNFDWELARATAAGEQERGATKEKQGIETSASQAQFNTPEKRRAYMAQHPDEFQDVSDFQKNDFILAGKFPQKEPAAPKPENVQQQYSDAVADAEKRGVDPAKDPKVQQLADAITSLQKQSPAPKENKAVAGTVAGSPAWGVQTEKGWVDPQTQKPIPNFKPAPNYAQVAPALRATNVLRKMPDGTTQLVGIHPDELKPGDVLAGTGAGMQTMSKEAQFQEIHSGIDNLRSAIKNLDKPFTPEQIGKLTLAMKHSSDPGVFRTELETIIGTQELTPAQEDLVIWMGHLNERALSLRNIAGMGQGSDSMRAAIQAILPGVKSGSTQMMNKQLAAFENQVTKLEKGVPKMPGDTGGKDLGAAPTGKADGSTGTMKVDGKDVKVVVRGGRIVEQ